MLTRCVIPAAGFGTRMLPAAKAVPKELLPLLDKPVLQYVVEEARHAGVTDAIIVTSPGKLAIESHFSPHEALDSKLRRSGRSEILDSLNDLIRSIRFHYPQQLEQRGLGHAVLMARQAVADEPFLCLLGDTIFLGDLSPAQQLADAYARLGTSVIGLQEVSAEKVERYGVVGGQMLDATTIRIDRFVEKPKASESPSRLAIAARYVLSPAIFQCIEQTLPGKGGEIQLTDALQKLLEREPVHGVVLRSARCDIGNPIDWLKTNLLLAARDPEMREALADAARAFLQA